MVEVSLFIDRRFALAESPFWDVASERLFWVDGHAGEIWSCDAHGADLQSWSLGAEIGAVALRRDSGALVAFKYGIGLFDFATGLCQRIAGPDASDPTLRLNDGRVDPQGRFVFGSIDMRVLDRAAASVDSSAVAKPHGALFRLDADLSLHMLADGIGCVNGPCWSPDRRTFYFTDSLVPVIHAFDWHDDAGTISHGHVFVPGAPGELPDGAVVDDQGRYWYVENGLFSGCGEVRCVAADGRLERAIPLPIAKVTALAFGGPGLDRLYVTSMSARGGPVQTAHDGAILVIDGLAARGMPAQRFAG